MPESCFLSPSSPKSQEEPLLNSYTDYEDSIYGTLESLDIFYMLEFQYDIRELTKIVGIAWSSHDPSLFASLSYDGRVSTCTICCFMELCLMLSKHLWLCILLTIHEIIWWSGCFGISQALLAEKMKLAGHLLHCKGINWLLLILSLWLKLPRGLINCFPHSKLVCYLYNWCCTELCLAILRAVNKHWCDDPFVLTATMLVQLTAKNVAEIILADI